MEKTFMVNATKLAEQLYRFVAFVRQMDGHEGPISFCGSTGFLEREENYKSDIADKACKALNFGQWQESWIGTGRIAACAKRAMSQAGNLVNKNQQVDFRNRLDPEHPQYRPGAERVLYDLYRNPMCEESEGFARAVEVFGAKYDTIAFLFFVKDHEHFLPISPGHFERGFAALDIAYATSRRCGWANYQGFIAVLQDIRAVMEDVLAMHGVLRLIDAHSFVWIIQEERFMAWRPNAEQSSQIERNTEAYLQGVVNGAGGYRDIRAIVRNRSAAVVAETRRRARGLCQLCHQPAPFMDQRGNPYLEAHHVIWLSRGGEDSTANTVALCPNCHTRMHVLNRPEDVERLKEVIALMV